MRALAAAASLFVSLPALAAVSPPVKGVPAEGEGTIAVLGGARFVPQGSFLDDQTAAGYRPWKTWFSPEGLLSLGYTPEPDFHVSIDLGYGVDQIHMTPGTLTLKSFRILLGADTSFLRRGWGTIYGGGGLGYSLNTLSQNGNDVEANSTAGYVCLGLRLPLTERLALVFEDRYTLTFAGLPGPSGPLQYGGSAGSINVGGNLFSVGLMFHYVDSEDASRPRHP